jgi:hypothetical protein
MVQRWIRCEKLAWVIRDVPGLRRYRSGKRVPPKQCLRVATQKKAKKNEAVDGMVRRRQRRWYWVVGESTNGEGRRESMAWLRQTGRSNHALDSRQSGTPFHCPMHNTAAFSDIPWTISSVAFPYFQILLHGYSNSLEYELIY